jgi:hypothetical protein
MRNRKQSPLQHWQRDVTLTSGRAIRVELRNAGGWYVQTREQVNEGEYADLRALLEADTMLKEFQGEGMLITLRDPGKQ